jgi:MarR family transcriptional regulator for hemolysin
MTSNHKKSPAAALHEQLGQTVHGLAKGWRQEMDRRLSPLGLTRTKWLALIMLSRHGAGLSQRELADKMEIGESAMVALLDRMEKDELIIRKPVPGDRRTRALELTAGGKRLISTIEGVAQTLREELLAGFTLAELKTTGDVLARMKAKVESFQ